MTPGKLPKAGQGEAGKGCPGTTDMLLSYVDRHMAVLGPYVSSVFLVLLLRSDAGRRKRGFIRIAGLSLGEIASVAGISKRKTIDALKALKGPLGNIPEFRKKIQDIVKDEEVKARLLKELGIEG